jgi:hypothetical protein
LQEEGNKQDAFLLNGVKETLEGGSAEARYIRVHEDTQYLHPGVEGTVAASKLSEEARIDQALVRKVSAECTVCPKIKGKVKYRYKSELIV